MVMEGGKTVAVATLISENSARPRPGGATPSDAMTGCSKCRQLGCHACRRSHSVLLALVSTLALVGNVHEAGRSLLASLNAQAEAEEGVTRAINEFVAVSGGHPYRQRRVHGKVYLTRKDLGVTQRITRKRRKIVYERTYESVDERGAWGESDLYTYTNLTRLEFDALLRKRWVDPDTGVVETLATLIDRPVNLCRKGKRRFTNLANQNRKRTNVPRLTAETRLLMTLHALTTPMTNHKLGLEYGVSAGMAGDTFYHVCDQLVLVLYDGKDASVVWPSVRQRIASALQLVGLTGCIGYIDGTRTRHKKPVANQRRSYSGKTKFHCR